MAEQKQDVDINENSGKSKKMLFIIIAIVILLGAGVAAFFLMGDDSEVEPEVAEKTKPTKQKAIYHSVEKPFIVNFQKQSDNRVKYMQIKLKVMARDPDAIDAFKLHLPAIQHELLMLFFSQNYDAMNTQEGTRALRQEALSTINAILTAEGEEQGLDAVYFTSLIMQ